MGTWLDVWIWVAGAALADVAAEGMTDQWDPDTGVLLTAHAVITIDAADLETTVGTGMVSGHLTTMISPLLAGTVEIVIAETRDLAMVGTT